MSTRNKPDNAVQKRLLEDITYELIPLNNLADQSMFLPAGSTVSVTCSPAKTIDVPGAGEGRRPPRPR